MDCGQPVESTIARSSNNHSSSEEKNRYPHEQSKYLLCKTPRSKQAYKRGCYGEPVLRSYVIFMTIVLMTLFKQGQTCYSSCQCFHGCCKDSSGNLVTFGSNNGPGTCVYGHIPTGQPCDPSCIGQCQCQDCIACPASGICSADGPNV